MSDVPQLGYRVVQITHQEPIPKEDKSSFPWLALIVLLFGLFCSPYLGAAKPQPEPQAASSARR